MKCYNIEKHNVEVFEAGDVDSGAIDSTFRTNRRYIHTVQHINGITTYKNLSGYYVEVHLSRPHHKVDDSYGLVHGAAISVLDTHTGSMFI